MSTASAPNHNIAALSAAGLVGVLIQLELERKYVLALLHGDLCVWRCNFNVVRSPSATMRLRNSLIWRYMLLAALVPSHPDLNYI